MELFVPAANRITSPFPPDSLPTETDTMSDVRPMSLIDELEARPGVSRDYSPRHLFDRIPKPLLRQLHREPAVMIQSDTWLAGSMRAAS